ncbi:MAG: hypothetical protein NVV57_03970 [Demequina sp.]|nr:hypothetical protein [Demequina sp.]
MADDPIGRLLDAAAGRLAAYGFLLTGSQQAGDRLVEDGSCACSPGAERPAPPRSTW